MHVLDGGARWRHLANTIIEPSMCGGDAVFLSSYFEHLVFIRPRRRATYIYIRTAWMRPIVTDRFTSSLGLYVTVATCAKTAEPIDMPLRLWTQLGPRKHVLHWGAHWRHRANTIEPSTFGGPAETPEPFEMPFGCGLGCPKEPCVRSESRSHHVKGQFLVERTCPGMGMPAILCRELCKHG